MTDLERQLAEALRECVGTKKGNAALAAFAAREAADFDPLTCPIIPGDRGPEGDAKAALEAEERRPPVHEYLFCPKCAGQHVDRDEWATSAKAHHKHLCEHCGHVWDAGHVGVGVATVGPTQWCPKQGDRCVGEPGHEDACVDASGQALCCKRPSWEGVRMHEMSCVGFSKEDAKAYAEIRRQLFTPLTPDTRIAKALEVLKKALAAWGRDEMERQIEATIAILEKP